MSPCPLIHTHTHTHTHTQTHTHTHTHTHLYIYIYIYIYTSGHTRVCLSARPPAGALEQTGWAGVKVSLVQSDVALAEYSAEYSDMLAEAELASIAGTAYGGGGGSLSGGGHALGGNTVRSLLESLKT
jgi:hypothetical protein